MVGRSVKDVGFLQAAWLQTSRGSPQLRRISNCSPRPDRPAARPGLHCRFPPHQGNRRSQGTARRSSVCRVTPGRVRCGMGSSIYDVLVTGFMIVALLAATQWSRGAGRSWLIVLGAATVGALLSKETWVVLPLFIFMLRSAVDDRTAARALATVAVIMAGLVLVYLAVRYPELSRLAASGAGGYSVTLGLNVVRNLVAYFAFPFHVTGVELTADTGIAGTSGYSLMALLILVIGACAAGLSRKASVCCACYVSYLLPVLVTARCEAQYLYGSGVPFAYLLAAMLTGEPGAAILKIVGGFAVLLLLAHTAIIDTNMYRTGQCQTRLLQSIDSFSATKLGGIAESNESIGILPALDSKWWILARALYATNTGGARGRFKVERDPAKAQLVFSTDCAVTRRPDPE